MPNKMTFYQKYKGYIILALIGLVMLITWLVLFRAKASSVVSKTSSTGGAGSTGCNTSKNNNELSFPIAYGDAGKQVKHLQRYANATINAALCPDGDWGPFTDAAIKKLCFTQPPLAGCVMDITEQMFTNYGIKNY